jgi:hypothetical protein
MRPTNDAIEHCRGYIERARAELQRRVALGRDTERLRKQLKTLEAWAALDPPAIEKQSVPAGS